MRSRLSPHTISTVAVLGAVFCGPALGASQSAWDSNRPRSIASIISAERGKVLDVFAVEPERRIALSGHSFPSLGSIQYMDSARATSAKRLDLIRRWVASYGIDPAVHGMFESEMLFREDSLYFWLPVQRPLIPYITAEVRREDPVTLFLVWAGAYGSAANIDWVFLVYGIRKQ